MSEVTQVVAPARRPADRLLAPAREYAITAAVAAVVFLVAYDNGGFGESTRDTLGIVLWWVLILCVGLGVWPLARTTRAAWAVGALLALFGLWTLLSAFWAADSAGAYAEFTRVMLYVAVFAVAAAGSRRDNAGRWVDGLALGIVAVAVIALVSRFFPGTFAQNEISRLIPVGATRLSFPLGYWNGLATLVALGIPLLLRVAATARAPFVRGVAVAPIPAMGGVIYLASSRVGVVSAAIASVAFLLLTARRWSAFAAAAVAGAGAAVAVLVLYERNALVNGPLGSPLAASQGHSAALILLGVCVLTGLLYGVGCRALEGRVRPSPVLGWVIVFAALALAIGGIAAAHPVRRFEQFKNPSIDLTNQSAIEQHLLSGSGNGRWQLWSSAIDEFDTKPLTGRGAQSFEAWWTQHGSLNLFVQDAHSLYAETLGELGIVGLLLLVGVLAAGLLAAGRRLIRAPDDQRAVLAAVTASFLAYLVASAFDWMWELTIVSVVAFVLLALATGPATSLASRPRLAASGESPRVALSRYGLKAAGLIAAWFVICAIAIPLLAGARIDASQAATERGDLRTAVRDALDAQSIQPWAPAPYQQLALLEELAGNYETAASWIVKAVRRDPVDWRLWLIRARIDTERGHIGAARRSLERCRTLHPKSAICQA